MSTQALTNEQLATYQCNGYLIVEDLLTSDEIDAFVAYENKGEYPPGPRGLQNHKFDSEWAYIAKHPRIVAIVQHILQGSPYIVQSMYMAKAAQGGTGVALHQDSHYLPNEPNTLMACWLALSDTDPENGGLCVVPSSHKHGLRSTHKTENTADHISWEKKYSMRDRNGKRWERLFYSFQIEGLESNTIRHLSVPRGAGVFFTSMTIHGSFANTSTDHQRLAFATHYIDAQTWMFREDVQATVPALNRDHL